MELLESFEHALRIGSRTGTTTSELINGWWTTLIQKIFENLESQVSRLLIHLGSIGAFPCFFNMTVGASLYTQNTVYVHKRSNDFQGVDSTIKRVRWSGACNPALGIACRCFADFGSSKTKQKLFECRFRSITRS